MSMGRSLTDRVLVLGLGLVLVGTGACASKKFVREGLGNQDIRINDLASEVEDGQRRLTEQGERLDSADATAGRAASRAEEAFELAKGRLLHKVVLSEKAGTFTSNKYQLSSAAKQALDKLATRLRSENANVWIEIEGHTDSTGSSEHNLSLGQRRADAVRHYLNEKHDIPLHRISVISFGESKPVADNGSRDGRAQNRRVEVRVLS